MARFTSGAIRIAYDVLGGGPETLVVTPGWVSHLDYDWSTPEIRAYYEQLAGPRTRRVVRYDKRGTGLSDRPSGADAYGLDAQVDDLLSVMDTVGIHRAVLLGWSQGGPIALAFAARYPQRVSQLILYGTYARLTFAEDYPIGRDPRVVSGLLDLIRAQWGLGSRAFASLILPEADADRLAWFTGYQRIATSPQVAADLIAANAAMDVRQELSCIQAPTLVLHRREDVLISFALGVYLAERIPRATFRELKGEHHVPYFGDTRAVVDAIDAFLRSEHSAAASARPLSTRELDVLRLLCDGSQDREIAQRLGISDATVGRHLANIYGKLGVSTRAAAAAIAVRRHLI